MSERAVDTIERGTAVAPTLAASAQDVLSFVHLGRWEWVEAELGLRQALVTSPNDPNVHQWYSQLLASVGNAERSLHHALEARKHDVLSPVVNDRLAVAYMWVDDDERSRRQFELADELGMGPTANPEAYVVLLLRRGEYDKARDILVDLQKLFARATEWIDPFIAAQRDPAARPAAREASPGRHGSVVSRPSTCLAPGCISARPTPRWTWPSSCCTSRRSSTWSSCSRARRRSFGDIRASASSFQPLASIATGTGSAGRPCARGGDLRLNAAESLPGPRPHLHVQRRAGAGSPGCALA